MWKCLDFHSIVFLEKNEGNVVGLIFGKVLIYTLIATDGMPLGWSIGKLLMLQEVFLLGIE